MAAGTLFPSCLASGSPNRKVQPRQESAAVNNSRFQRSEQARRQVVADVLEAKERASAAVQERDATFAIETNKVENLRAQRLAQPTAVKAKPARASPKPAAARKDLAA